MTTQYTLYGMEASLYSARARSYMRKNDVPFVEVVPGSPEFMSEIVPTTGRWMIPVMKTPQGEIIQDGADIIDHLDQAGFSKTNIYPEDPHLLVIAHVFELFGAQGLLRPAMHYRWNFDETNLSFIQDSFGDFAPPGASAEVREQVFLQMSGFTRKATKAVGASVENAPQVEQSYEEFLLLMNAHLEAFPYLLGGHATIADYGLIGAMYAHLGRDPVPLHLMQTKAPRVFRWVERMNMSETALDRTQVKSGDSLIEGDAIPQTLKDLLSFIATDYLPEISAHVDFVNDWLDEHPEVTTGTSTKDEIMRGRIGFAKFAWRGIEMSSWVVPYRFYLLCRLQSAFERQSEKSKDTIRSTMSELGLEDMLNIRTKRPVLRVDNHEAWGELVSA